ATRQALRSAKPMVATAPALKPMKSASRPSLKITPCSGIYERSTSGWRGVSLPNTRLACEVRLVKASRTVKYNSSASHGGGWFPGGGGWVVGRWGRGVVGGGLVRRERTQPVEPAPVETISPLELWSSAWPAYSSR